MTPRTVVELAAFQAVWFACALGAAHGRSAPGVVAAALYVAGQFILGRPRRAIVVTTLAGGAAGLFMETLLIHGGVLSYAAPWPEARIAPAWMVALWLAFGSAVPTTARLIGDRRFAKAAILGALAGPAAYLAGARLGALHLIEPAWVGVAGLALSWGLIFPALTAIARHADA